MVASGREFTVVELDGPRLCALAASANGGRLEVARWLAAVRPENIAADDPDAVGTWIGQELERAELGRRRVILCLPRGEVVLKTLTLPKPADSAAGQAELAAMVRLQMLRQLTMSAEGTPIDFLPMGEEVGKDGASNVSILAGAFPGDRDRWWKQAAESGGLKIVRVALRCLGAGAVLAELSQRRNGPVLGIAIGPCTTELIVVEHGAMVFARGVDVPAAEAEADSESFADRIAVEAKRTWIGYKSGRGNAELELVAVAGVGRLAELVSQRCGSVLEVKGEAVGLSGAVLGRGASGWNSSPFGVAMAGVLLDAESQRESIDFAHPRKAPDLNARKRQLVLAGTFGAILLGGAGYVLADQRLGQLRTDLALAQAQEKEINSELDRMLLAKARLDHMEQWKSAKVDWVAHAKALSEQMPEPRLAQLEEFGGSMGAAIAFNLKGTFPNGMWSNQPTATFRLGGRMEGRQIASDLRDQLLASGVYAVQSKGADVPERFSLVLETTLPVPEAPAPPADKEKPKADKTDKAAPTETGKGGKP